MAIYSTDVRPLVPIAPEIDSAIPVTPEWLASLPGSEPYRRLLEYFREWPARSFMTAHSRAVLFALVRALRPQVVVEVGTLFAGTTEVLARALWENGRGMVHTTDPFGAERCPATIGSWQPDLRARTRYHALNSMDFFAWLDTNKVRPDLVLVDGNHDYEFALFDLLMSARLLRPGGIVIMDNAEQTGPFRATREFLAANAAWRELGSSVANYAPSVPFDEKRSSVPGTTFVVVQSPTHITLGHGPASWGQSRTELAAVDGFALQLPAQRTSGVLHYQVIFRAFGDANRDGRELRSIGSIRLDLAGEPLELRHGIAERLDCSSFSRYPDAIYTFEVDLSWQPDGASAPLALGTLPSPIVA